MLFRGFVNLVNHFDVCRIIHEDKTMMRRTLGAVTALGLLAAPAFAATQTVTYQDPDDPFGAGQLFSRIQIDSPVFDGTYRAGQFEFTLDGIEDILAFCIEVTQGLRDNKDYEDTPGLFSTAVIDNIDRLFTSAYDSITDGVSAAAFQVALWEIVEDTATGIDLTSGNFLTPSNTNTTQQQVRTTAQSFLDGLGSADTGGFALRFFAADDSQDFVTFERISPVPLPASGLLLLSAGLGASLLRRKRRAV